MLRFALIAAAVAMIFSAFAVTSAEAGGYGRPGYAGPAAKRAHMVQGARIKNGRHAAAAIAAGLLGVAAITEAISYNYRARFDDRAYAGIRPGGLVVAHNPDFPLIEGYGNPCGFERVMDFYGRPTSRVVKVCR